MGTWSPRVVIDDAIAPSRGMGPGDELRLAAGDTPVRLILVAGRPIGEPIVRQGPFVLNNRAEIEQAFRDFRDDRLVQEPSGAGR